jgi:AbiV family abortive infection protein
MTPFKPEVLRAIEACRSHAQDLFEGAKQLREKSLPNLSYHLATLALEELGKGQLIGMKSFAKDDADSWYGKQFDDHLKKLFWALWGQFLATPPDNEEIERLKGTASIIHNNRMRGLYVEAVAQNFVAPRDAISDEMLAPLMTLVEAKLALQPSLQGAEYTQEDLDLLNWFSNVTDVPEKRNFIFSKTSFDRMAELGAREWLGWIRDEIEKSSAAAMASLQKEMARGFTEGEEGQQEKWELKLRFFSQSHSIRPKPLNRWNEKVDWIKLYPVNGKKNHIDVILKIPRFITIKVVYYVGYGYSNLLLAALNIASSGLLWWHEPKNLSTFYESLVDKENQMTGVIGRVPELKLGWPAAVLDEVILDRAITAFAMMPQPYEPPEASEALNHYMTGVGLIAKTDVFLQFEMQAYGAFLSSAKVALRLYREDLGEQFPTDIPALLSSLSIDDAFKKKHCDLVARYERRALTMGLITLSEVVEMKRICDSLFMHTFNMRAQNRAAREDPDNSFASR